MSALRKKKRKGELPSVLPNDLSSLSAGGSAPIDKLKLLRSATHSQTKPKEAPVPEKDDKLHYDPEDDVWLLEEVNPSPGRKYAMSVMNAIRLVLTMASFLGLFPLLPKRLKQGTFVCKFSWSSHATILFLFAATIVGFTTIWLFVSAICISTNTPEHYSYNGTSADIYRSEEIFILKRNTIFLVIIYASFTHLTVCMTCVFLRRDYIAKQIVYWTELVNTVKS